MPKDYLALDTNFPSFTGTETTDQKVDQLYNYTYMLLENLRYTLRNLDGSNFNETGLNDITDPIYKKIEDAEGNIAELALDAKGLALRLSNAEGDINQLEITAQGMAAQIKNAEGDITTLQATAKGLEAQIKNAEGDITTLQATAQGLQTQIKNAEGNITSLQITAQGLQTQITNQAGDINQLQITANGLSVTLGQQGQAITQLQFTINGLTITGPGGTTMINGGSVYTPTLVVQDLYGATVNLKNINGQTLGGIGITGSASSFAAIDITSFGALRLTANTGDTYIEAAGAVTLSSRSAVVSTQGNLIPSSSGGYSLGNNSFPWSTAYLNTDPVVVSDRKEKNSINYDLEKYRNFFRGLRPCSFRYNTQEKERTQIGFVVQDVEEDMEENELLYDDFAGIVIEREKDKEYRGLRVNHITALNTWMIQELLRRVETLEGGKA